MRTLRACCSLEKIEVATDVPNSKNILKAEITGLFDGLFIKTALRVSY